jgi:catechol 2,3-dioxygenase-like lactoylglutathione lyase family enzyme
MLGHTDAHANLAVRSLAAARTFYETTLGLVPVHEEGGELVVYKSGNSRLNVYRSDYAGSNKATAVTWAVADVDEVVRNLKGRGVTFEHYEMPGLQRDGDVHVGHNMRVAWFKDPDGNILNIVSR